MTRRILALLPLLAILATGCSTTASGTAVVGPAPAAGSTAPPITASSTTALSTTALSTTASSTTAGSTTALSTTAGSTTAGATTAPSASAEPTKAPSATRNSTPRNSTTAMPTVSAATFPLCHAVVATDAGGLVSCVRTSLSTFWSGQLDQVVDQPVVVEPTAAQVPQRCRSAITTTSAFTCQINNTVYLNAGLLDSARKSPPGEMLYVFAAVLGHEIGHVVQAAVMQPGYTDTGTSDAISQRIEQQADCLDGVWAHAVIAAGQLDRATFVRVTNTFITSISSNPEISTHGTPPVRAAALAKGLKNGRPQDCGLATFS